MLNKLIVNKTSFINQQISDLAGLELLMKLGYSVLICDMTWDFIAICKFRLAGVRDPSQTSMYFPIVKQSFIYIYVQELRAPLTPWWRTVSFVLAVDYFSLMF